MAQKILPRVSLPVWARPEHPVFNLEASRQNTNPGARLLRQGCLPLILGVTSFLVTLVGFLVLVLDGFWSVEYFVRSLLGFSFGAMVVTQILAGATTNILTMTYAAPLISSEVELQSWSLLRSTSMRLRDIIFAKFAATLVQLRMPLIGLLVLRMISLLSGLFFIAFSFYRDSVYYWQGDTWATIWLDRLWVPAFVVGLLLLVYYMSQPIVQFMMNNALGVLASSMSNSRGRAIATALAFRLTLWVVVILFHVGLGVAFGALFSEWVDPRYSSIGAFRGRPSPSEAQIIIFLSAALGGYVVAMIGSQLGLVVATLGITQRRARRLIG